METSMPVYWDNVFINVFSVFAPQHLSQYSVPLEGPISLPNIYLHVIKVTKEDISKSHIGC